jgi:Fe-S cluster biogenesis protein NfuA
MENTLLQRVETAIDSIRPYLKDDGGDVRVVEITEEKKVILELIGACSSCPMSPSTMKSGIEEAIKRFVPEITSIEAINLTVSQ